MLSVFLIIFSTRVKKICLINVYNFGFQAGCSILDRSAINPAPDVTGDYSSADEDDGPVPSPGGGSDLGDVQEVVFLSQKLEIQH